MPDPSGSVIPTNLPTYGMGAKATLLFTLDVTASLNVGETPSAPVVTLIDDLSGVAFPTGLIGVPSFVGNILSQKVGGLRAGHTYKLQWVYQTSGGNTWEYETVILCGDKT